MRRAINKEQITLRLDRLSDVKDCVTFNVYKGGGFCDPRVTATEGFRIKEALLLSVE